MVIAVGHDCGSKGWDYEVRFDNLPGREGIALDWWLYESELVDPFKDVEIDVASML